ncbi:hypothetical protein [Streptomyces griseorubiginosus]|uniref:hypothetical protein n=1 Tax=Streptomyces griseorubiginosus TaxID=67304 RepID=UPI001AD61D14|nr:hypothetical protein [Streptomyces griseorubiginosus]MBO4252552.1 hypothetical protein [Streptomyces griseorubiginosus]
MEGDHDVPQDDLGLMPSRTTVVAAPLAVFVLDELETDWWRLLLTCVACSDAASLTAVLNRWLASW